MVVKPMADGRSRCVWEDRDVEELAAYVRENMGAKAEKQLRVCLVEFAAKRGCPVDAVEGLWYRRARHLCESEPRSKDELDKTLLQAAAKKGGRLRAEDIQKVAEAFGVTYARAFATLGRLHLSGEIAVQERADLVREVEALKKQVKLLEASLETAVKRLQELEQFRLGLKQLVA